MFFTMQIDVKEKKALAFGGIVVVGILLLNLSGWYIYDNYFKVTKPKVMTAEQVKQSDTVAKEIHVTPPESQTIVREIQRSSDAAPQITYYVQSPTVRRAAEIITKQIETKAPETPSGLLKKSDRTIITADNDRQKVDVYKITLRKAHKIKTGMTYVDNHAYLSAGYQAGRWEGLAHFNNDGFKGATVMYTIKEW